MFRLKTLLAPGLALALALTLGVGSASADISATYTLDTPNSGLSATGPYGTVTVTIASAGATTATIDFKADSGFFFGDGGSAAVNASSNTSFGAITGGTHISDTAPNGDPIYSYGGSVNNQTFGDFNQSITSFDGATWESSEIKFTLTNTNGFSSPLDVLTANAGGYSVMAHIFPAGASSSTGFAVNGSPGVINPPPTPGVPEPSTMLIAAVGALGFLGYGLRRRRKS